VKPLSTNFGLRRVNPWVNPQVTFIVLALMVNVAASLAARNRITQIAASVDMTITVSALYYWLLVRPGIRSAASLLVVAMLGLTRAAFAFPNLIPGRELLAIGAECALVATLVPGFVIGFRSRAHLPDPLDRFRGEFGILYYAFAWRARPHLPADAQPFTLHNRSGFGDKILFVGLAALFEILPVHILLHRKSAAAAWVLTGLSVYGLIWLVAVARSLRLRPSFVQPGEATIRLGLLFSLRIPAGTIANLSAEPKAGALALPRTGAPNVCIELTHPLKAKRLIFLTREVAALALTADEPEALTAALRSMAY
jgi:hypothetical protein